MVDSTTQPPVVADVSNRSPDATAASRPEERPGQSPAKAKARPSAARRAAAKASGETAARPASKPRSPVQDVAAKGDAKRKQPPRATSETSTTARSARSGGSHSRPAPASFTSQRPSPRGAAGGGGPTQRSAFSKDELQLFRNALLAERERLVEEVAGLREESLLRHDEVNHEEDGTDAYIRLSGLDRAGQEQARVIQIDEALRTLDEGRYGLCELCGCCIETARLELLPFVTTCIRCQSEAEGGTRARISARARLWQ